MTHQGLHITSAPLVDPEVDPPIFEVINADSDYPVVLVCEHAGREIPAKLNNLGLPDEVLTRHIAWDIGAAAVTRKMAQLLRAPAVLQAYSRLVIDCNRPTDQPTSIPVISDGVTVTANQQMSTSERQQRISEIFNPFQDRVKHLLDHKKRSATFAIHSFTPIMDGVSRPWDIGFLFRNDAETSHWLANYFANQHKDIIIGMNQPYQITNDSDWFVPQHGEKRRLAHSLIEIRNDHIIERNGQSRWALMLSETISKYIQEIHNEPDS